VIKGRGGQGVSGCASRVGLCVCYAEGIYYFILYVAGAQALQATIMCMLKRGEETYPSLGVLVHALLAARTTRLQHI